MPRDPQSVVIPLPSFSDPAAGLALACARSLARSGARVEVVVLDLDPDVVEDGARRVALPRGVALVSPYRGEVARPRRWARRMSRVARRGGSETVLSLGDTPGAPVPAHVVTVPDALAHRVPRDVVLVDRARARRRPDGSVATRERLDDEGRVYQVDTLAPDGRATTVTWFDVQTGAPGSVVVADHARGTVRRYPGVRSWHAACITERAGLASGPVTVLAVTDDVDALLAGAPASGWTVASTRSVVSGTGDLTAPLGRGAGS